MFKLSRNISYAPKKSTYTKSFDFISQSKFDQVDSNQGVSPPAVFRSSALAIRVYRKALMILSTK